MRIAGLTLYDRYVQRSSQCDEHEEAVSMSIAVADGESCSLYVCRERSNGH